jgi:hypothetical protein
MKSNPLVESGQLSLSEEKKRLQTILHKYQTQFTKDTGRVAENQSDWEPVRKEYKQYKEIKKQLDMIKKGEI